jgi:dGTPase
MKFLQNLVWRHVIRSPRLAAQQWGQTRIVRKLFRAFLRSVRDRGTDDGLMIVPAAFLGYVDQIPAAGDPLPPEAQEVRLAADIVASLSDAQAVAIYRKLMGERLGSITDPY